jgi:hypothetical protein
MTPAEWDARAMADVAVLIRRYVAETPPPAGAQYAGDFLDWAERLETAGRIALRVLHTRRLRTAAGT